MSTKKTIFLTIGGCLGLLLLVSFIGALFISVNKNRLSSSSIAYDSNYKNISSPLSSLGVRDAFQDQEGAITQETGSKTDEALPERMVVKTAELSLKVKSVEETKQQLASLVVKNQGYIVSSQVTTPKSDSDNLVLQTTIKVPVEVFDQVLLDIKGLAIKVVSEHVQGTDVTEEYIDTQARLKNLEATEAQFLEIMKKATKIQDILDVQRELTSVRENIERLKGRIQYLEKSSQLSTITLTIATEEKELPIVEEKWDPLKTIKAALRDMIGFWQLIGDIVIWLVVFFGPLAIVIVVISKLALALWRKKKI